MNDTTTVGTSHLATDETDRLISSDKVEDTSVYNPRGESLGKVYHLMIDKYTGQVDYAVISYAVFCLKKKSCEVLEVHVLALGFGMNVVHRFNFCLLCTLAELYL